MAVIDQPKTTYSDTTPFKKAISDLIEIIDPSEAPVVKYFGLEGTPAAFRVTNWPSTKVYWLEDELAPLTDTLAASCTSDATTLQVTDGSVHKIGDVILINAEHMWVSSISTNTLTVTRNFGGTQATHAAAETVTLITNARLEGADADYDRALTDVGEGYNYTQIFEDDLEITGSQQQISQYGITDEMEYQLSKKLPEQLRLVERAFFQGQRKSGSATTPRAFGGLETFITTNTTSMSNGALTEKAMVDAVQQAWSYGGMPKLLVCNAWVKRKIASFYAPNVRTERDETRGGVMIDSIDTEFGALSVLMDRWCPSTSLYVLDPRFIGFIPFRSWNVTELAKTGDAEKRQFLGEYTLVLKNQKAHAWIKSISSTK